MSIHKKIKQARIVKGWTQEEVAEKLNITTNAYGAIERGESHPTIPKLQKLCDVFEIELSELLESEETQIIHIAYKKAYKNNSHHHYNIGKCSQEYLELQTELEKQLLIVELKDKELAMQQREIQNLQEQVLQLKEINTLLKKEV
jgi:transcriptional regulator with XRE-family HTH domain